MAEINEVIERVTTDLNRAIDVTRDRNVKFTIHAGDATKLLDELETVRAERDALRAALESERVKGHVTDAPWIYPPNPIVGATAKTAQPAPQAEWTPPSRFGYVQMVEDRSTANVMIGFVAHYYNDGEYLWRRTFNTRDGANEFLSSIGAEILSAEEYKKRQLRTNAMRHMKRD